MVAGGGLLVADATVHAAPEGRPCLGESANETIQYGETVTCEINPRGDSDDFRFNGAPGEKVVITAAIPVSGGVGAPCIDLFAPDGATLGSSCAFSPINRIDAVLALSGTYTIRVTDRSNDQTGGYILALDRLVPLTGRETALRYGSTLTDQTLDPRGISTFLRWVGWRAPGSASRR